MSFDAFMGGILFLSAPMLLAVLLVKGVALPFGPVVKAKAQPLRFAAYCALYLAPLLFQAFLFYREHPATRETILLLLCAINVIGALRPSRQVEPSLSRYEFATIRTEPRPQRGYLIFWLLLSGFWLSVTMFKLLAGQYPALF